MIMDLRIGMIIINQETGETTMSEYIIRERENPFQQIVLNQLFAIKSQLEITNNHLSMLNDTLRANKTTKSNKAKSKKTLLEVTQEDPRQLKFPFENTSQA